MEDDSDDSLCVAFVPFSTRDESNFKLCFVYLPSAIVVKLLLNPEHKLVIEMGLLSNGQTKFDKFDNNLN